MANSRSRKYGSGAERPPTQDDTSKTWAGSFRALFSDSRSTVVLTGFLGVGLWLGFGMANLQRNSSGYEQGLEKRVKDLTDGQAALVAQRDALLTEVHKRDEQLKTGDQNATEQKKALQKQLSDAQSQIKSKDATIRSVCALLRRPDAASICPTVDK